MTIEDAKPRGGRTCPVTKGNPTSMTEAGWTKVCALSREKAEEELDIANRKVLFKGACLLCDGGIPAEVTIVELPAYKKREEIMGSVKTWDGTCYCCKQPRKVRRTGDAGDKEICPRCDHLRAEVKLRPELVVSIIRDVAPELLGQHQAANEQTGNCDTCEVASWAASYQQLCGALKATDGEDIVEVAKRRMAVLAKLEAQCQMEAVALSNAEAERDELKRQLEIVAAGDGARIAALEEDVDIAMSLVNEANKISASVRADLQDLAIRLALCMLKGEARGIGVSDVELLRSMA